MIIKDKVVEQESCRINKYISNNTGLSRRKGEDVIRAGLVKVDGIVCLNPAHKVCVTNKVTISNNLIKKCTSHVTYIFNKPKGVVCSNKRQGSETIVKDFFKDIKKILTVGRLDKDVHGLLIVTTNHQLVHEISHPSKNIQKEYIVETDREIDSNDLKNLSSVIVIDNKKIKPIKVQKLKKNVSSIIVIDGKNHEIKEIYRKANLTILDLKRIRIGGLNIGKLKPGEKKIINEDILLNNGTV